MDKHDEENKYFTIYTDHEGSFQADIYFMPKNQVYNKYQGIVCLILTNWKIVWTILYQAPRDLDTEFSRQQLKAEKMYPFLTRCINEIERRSHIQAKQIDRDDKT